MSEGPFSLFSELGMAQLVHSSKRKHSGRTIRSCITVRSNAADFALNAWDPGSFSPYPVGPPSTADDISVERGHHLRCWLPSSSLSLSPNIHSYFQRQPHIPRRKVIFVISKWEAPRTLLVIIMHIFNIRIDCSRNRLYGNWLFVKNGFRVDL